MKNIRIGHGYDVHKFTTEIHANEIVLLAYYVAAINIEETFHSIVSEYKQFEGIVLTDTFQMTEGKNELDSLGIFPDNNERVIKQNNLDIRVIIGNPPYAVRANCRSLFLRSRRCRRNPVPRCHEVFRQRIYRCHAYLC